ncbi:serine hydrolase [Arthrobacter sp. SO3]|uniref:serine hydrolase n=1 Tax=Arthrobacter sp. SO3 TaxID=1897057 RepID=UPI001CFFD730|nr:serine hydrolase [Arthrobacter sp. SO3]
MGGIRPQFLIVLVAVLGLVSTATVYAAIQARVPVDAAAPPATPASASASPYASADAGAAGPLAAAAATPSALPSAPAPTPAPVLAPPAPAIGPALDAEINAVLTANSGYRVGVALIDVRDGAVHEYGVKTKFVAASTGKILAAAAYYHLVETGKASLAARMGASTAGQQIRQMVQQSNNESWALILNAVGYNGLTDYAASLGIPYDRTVNSLTPAEMAKILAELYSGRLLNPANTAQLLSYMQKTNYERLIPAAVPAGVSVFHKYGLLNGYLHDASILVQGERAFVFVVYTLGWDGPEGAARRNVFHELTGKVTAGLF